MSYLIRKAEVNDDANLLALVLEFVEDNKKRSGLGDKYYELFGGDFRKNRELYVNEMLQSDNGECILALDDNKIIGYGYIYYDPSFNISSVDELFVKVEYRKKGIGSKLFNELLSWAKEKGNRIRIEVFDWNNDAKLFYEKYGFKIESQVLTNYYPVNEQN